jgi:hypothetical protein
MTTATIEVWGGGGGAGQGGSIKGGPFTGGGGGGGALCVSRYNVIGCGGQTLSINVAFGDNGVSANANTANSNVRTGTYTITAMEAASGSHSLGPVTGGVGGFATGGTVANIKGNDAAADIGGAAQPDSYKPLHAYGFGGNGGTGGSGATLGGNGAVYIIYS